MAASTFATVSNRDGRSPVMEKPAQILIDGAWRASSTGANFPAYDPATGGLLGEFAAASPADVDAAVAAARRALTAPEWAQLTPAARGRLLWRLADLIDANGEELAYLETRDQGQPLGVARGVSVTAAAEHFRYFAGWTTKLEGRTSPVSIPGVMHYTRREPIGVCALITPWNFPLMIASWKLAPALACGNTVILKPAEQTSVTTVRLAELCVEAGIPAGVVNLLTGGPEVGAALVRHTDVDKVSFTGSTEVGRDILRASAGNLKRTTLELGGKAPMIIASDADIDLAVAGCVQGALFNSGQVCAAYARFYIDHRRVDEFVEKAAAQAKSMKLGPGLDETTQLGPLVSEDHLRRVDSFVRSAIDEGAELVAGGARAGGALENGYFYEPTVFAGVGDDMTIAREEIFGPVVPLLSYDDIDEVLARANASDFGLAASVWTNDLVTAHRLAAGLQAGSVFVNMLHVPDPAAPWGGYKSSGHGREMGPYALDAYTETKGVFINLAR